VRLLLEGAIRRIKRLYKGAEKMEVIDVIRKRRSIRKYKNKPVEEKRSIILETGRLAPSRANVQPWRFIVVTDQTIKDEFKFFF
jgi:nitroreductase